MATNVFRTELARAKFSLVLDAGNVPDGRRTAPKISSLEKILNPLEPVVVESRNSTKEVCLNTTAYELSRDSTPEDLTFSQPGSSPFHGGPDRTVILLTACNSSPTTRPDIEKDVMETRLNSRLYDTGPNQQTPLSYHLEIQSSPALQHDSAAKSTLSGVKEEEEDPKIQPKTVLPRISYGSTVGMMRLEAGHPSKVITPPRMQVTAPSLPLIRTPLSWQAPLVCSQQPFEPSMQGVKRPSISGAPDTFMASHPRFLEQQRLPDPPFSVQSQQAPMGLPDREEYIPIHIDTSTASIRADRKRKRNAVASTKYRRRKKMLQEKEFKDYQKLLGERRLMENKIVELTQQAHFYRQECFRLQDVIRQTSAGSFAHGLQKSPLNDK
ncbi:hypothetical protein NW762_014574 [Fusarium torreyae]|uniref:BZIP domain-containing protein n=1 Tax=Fusarium torreyae TaxID=1237075 RepID=A0A9W8V6G7_9HYPO|nr:hypothetical protein NW762_014574 [Fusarium torreyae]